MHRSEFHYELPDELIAQQPLPGRGDSRLLVMHRHRVGLADHRFRDLPGLLSPGDLVVFNDTRVIPARLFGRKESGGRVEILLERLTGDGGFIAMLRSSKPLREGQAIQLEDGTRLVCEGRDGAFFRLRCPPAESPLALFERLGQMPLPPYIRRAPEAADRERYQTLFARTPGAVAAPTASLHFDADILAALDRRGIGCETITLHVGAGTFQPVRVDDIENHVMHSEWFEVGEHAVERIRATRAAGGRIFAAGTTSLRALEAASADGELRPLRGETRLFIRPGYRFRTVQGLVTNFHLPESTLLMLVSAFAGTDEVRRAYEHAIRERYRFFSYGDAMLILPDGED